MLARDSLVQAGLPDNPYARQLRNGFRWLRFEKELENEFREFLSWNSLMQRRAAIGVAFLIWALFIVADWMMVDIRLHPSLFEQLLGVRLGMIGLLLVVWPAAFLPSLRKVGDAIAPYCLLLINLAVLARDVLFEWHGCHASPSWARPWASSRCSSRSAWRSGPACAWRCCAWP